MIFSTCKIVFPPYYWKLNIGRTLSKLLSFATYYKDYKSRNIYILHLNVDGSFNKLLPANRHESCSVLGRGRHNKYKAKMMIKDWTITDENGGDGNNFRFSFSNLIYENCLRISPPTHPHLGEISQKKTFFFGSFPYVLKSFEGLQRSTLHITIWCTEIAHKLCFAQN